MWGASVYFTRNLSEKWYWIVHDRQGAGPFRKAGQGSAGYGVPPSSSSASSSSLSKDSPSSTSSLLGASSKHHREANPFESLDEFDDDTEAFVAEL
jgi:hypothetical protein